MKHAREDYDRIQDPDFKIPADEPVFLIRGQDVVSGDAVRQYAELHARAGGSREIYELALRHAELMDLWPKKKNADL